MRKRFLLIAMCVILAVTGLWYIAAHTGKATKQVQAPVELGVTPGKGFAGFTLADLEGKQVTVGQAGKVAIINFWATWCPPCREEMPELDRFAQKHRKSVDFYAINIQEHGDKVSEFLKQSKYTMTVLLDSDGTVAKNFRISAIPTTIVVDKDGVIKFRKSGPMTMNELEEIVKGL